MKAVALCRESLPALQDVQLPPPLPPRGRDLLVRVQAISVNPVDAKQRAATTDAMLDRPRVLGWDAAGVVEAIGEEASLFASGDEVYYAGDVTRPGCNAQYQWVDERLVARKPTTLDFAEAAALPLTTLTAWELLFQRMPLQLDGRRHAGQRLLVIGGAGGVGSMAIQLAQHAGFEVIATASREASVDWCRRMGAAHVIDHHQPLLPQLQALGIDSVQVALNLADTDHYWDELGQIVAPQGHVGLIVEPRGPLRIGDPYKAKCIGIHWEFMFARARFQTADQIEQHRILNRAASMIDAGQLRGTLSEVVGSINAANLQAAHERLASGRTIGKLALSGWE
ncbi:zinc-binding alcohol dehydrogenase family protein [Stenotrophomonas sp. SAU14A_NAIMI4_8]|uniref:zinc-binding alcohol dehydrogenase family protein n=1 Tax=Stenotrophomonas sp. SAU14A_NAIMI4_8 TaxID=2072409 RepID=UPI000D53F59B|nr:zinc-binding alcohol dehydrogenase family protein [Stenotrophomonas sp. SAU14A_NAIMI4_8]AWH35071.1 zinc-binding alcohol dehydrogenase family protein [Stenotrophomonas sp. SAU14A_NAIMI4_8]